MPTDWTPSSLLAWWFGAPDVVPTRPTQDLPAALLDLHEALSGYLATGLRWQNTLLEPAEITSDGGLQVFWVENEQVSVWGTDGEEVFELTQGSDTWMPTGLSLAAFCVALLVFEIAVSSEHTAAAEVAEADLDFALTGFSDLPMPGPLVDSDLYAADDALVFASGGWVCLGARDAAALARHERRL